MIEFDTTGLEGMSLTLNLAKCDFGKAVVTYLGKQVGQGQVCPLLAKVQAILDFHGPETQQNVWLLSSSL